MKITLFSVCLLLSLLLALTVFFPSMPCKAQLQWAIYTQIEVSADGSATWVVQQRTVLATEDDEAAFLQYLNITFADQISSVVHSMVDRASLVTGRSMRVENLAVNATISNMTFPKRGIVQYGFDWLGFGEKSVDGKIKVGNAFDGELDLSRDDVLTIKYPSEFKPVFSYPRPDETRESEGTLTWLGLRNFGAGEPDVLFEKRSFGWADVVVGNIPLYSLIVAAVTAGFLGYFVGVRRAYASKRKASVGQEQTPFFESGVVDDEEKVVSLLVAAKGQMLQSTIAKQCGFSKSKASELLSVMEGKGIITRKKMGKGKIVSLVEKQRSRKSA